MREPAAEHQRAHKLRSDSTWSGCCHGLRTPDTRTYAYTQVRERNPPESVKLFCLGEDLFVDNRRYDYPEHLGSGARTSQSSDMTAMKPQSTTRDSVGGRIRLCRYGTSE